MKLFVFASLLCCCALARAFIPKSLDLAFHAELDYMNEHQDCYFIVLGKQLLAMNCNNGKRIVRCDGPDGECFIKTKQDNGQYHCGWQSMDGLVDFFFPQEFQFSGEPQPTTCPGDDSQTCTRFTLPDGSSCFVDSQKRVVGRDGSESFNITFHDDVPSNDMFYVTYCSDDEPYLPLPSYGSFYRKVDCASHINVYEQGSPVSMDVTLIEGDGRLMYFLINYSSSEHFIMRCDNDDEYGCYAEVKRGGECQVPFADDPEDFLMMYLPRRFDYTNVSEPVSCTEGGTEQCVIYSSSLDGKSIVVDSENRIVALMQETKNPGPGPSPKGISAIEVTTITYLDDVPSLDVFDDLLECNSTAFPPATMTCGSSSSSSSPSGRSSASSTHSSTSPKSSSAPVLSAASLRQISVCAVVAVFALLLL